MKFKLMYVDEQYRLLLENKEMKYLSKQEARNVIKDYDSIAAKVYDGKDHLSFFDGIEGELIASCGVDKVLNIHNAEMFRSILTLDPDEFPYVTAGEYAEQAGRTQNQIRRICRAGDFEGAVSIGTIWLIPKGAKYPRDKRAGRKWKKKKNPSDG